MAIRLGFGPGFAFRGALDGQLRHAGQPALVSRFTEHIRSASLSFIPFGLFPNNMRQFTQDPEDKVLWTLTSTGGKADRIYLRRRLDMKLAELEPVLAALESKKKIKRTDFEEKGKTNQMISLA
jgi:hypothetical protein